MTENNGPQKIRVTDEVNSTASTPKIDGVSGARADLVLMMVQIKQGITLLRALRDTLPYKLAPEARQAIIALLTRNPEAEVQAVETGVNPRDLMDARIATLQRRVRELEELLDSLPLKFPTQGADRALSALIQGQIKY